MPISPYVRRLRDRVGSDLLLLPDDDEVVDVDWVAPDDLSSLDFTPLARATFAALRLV